MLKYTQPMRQQDTFWKMGQSNREGMQKQQIKIIDDFKAAGNPSHIHFNQYLTDNESIVDVYTDANIDTDGTIYNAKSFATCSSLINYLNTLNQSASLSPEQIDNYAEVHDLNIFHYFVKDVEGEDLTANQETTSWGQKQPDDDFYAVENEDGRWLITGTKAEIKQYIAQQIYQEN